MNARSPKYKRNLKDYEQKRFEELKIQYHKVTWKHYRNKEVERGWTLMDIACAKWRYEKYYNGYRKALEERAKKREQENWINPNGIYIDEDVAMNQVLEEIVEDFTKHMKENIIWEKEEESLANKHFKICCEACHLMISRNKKYGDSWKVLSVQSIANLCEMKLNRIAKLGEVDAKTEDELIDTLNYMVFGLIKLKEWKKSKN